MANRLNFHHTATPLPYHAPCVKSMVTQAVAQVRFWKVDQLPAVTQAQAQTPKVLASLWVHAEPASHLG